MKKRLKKKLAKNRCPKCHSNDGVVCHYHLRSGRLTSRYMFCFNCNPDFKEFERNTVLKLLKGE